MDYYDAVKYMLTWLRTPDGKRWIDRNITEKIEKRIALLSLNNDTYYGTTSQGLPQAIGTSEDSLRIIQDKY